MHCSSSYTAGEAISSFYPFTNIFLKEYKKQINIIPNFSSENSILKKIIQDVRGRESLYKKIFITVLLLTRQKQEQIKCFLNLEVWFGPSTSL